VGLTRRGALAWPLSACGALSGNALVVEASTSYRQLRFALTFTNPTPRLLRKQTYWGYLPARETPYQRLVDVQASTPMKLRQDELGHQIGELAFEEIAPWASKSVSLAVKLEMSATPRLEPLPVPLDWLQPERFIESDNPNVIALARELRSHDATDTGRAVYDWVATHIAYAGYNANDLGAARALADRRGDCTEFAYLAVALARASGIPARMLGGYVTDRDAAPKASQYHNWAELHLDGTWRLLDAQKRHWWAPLDDYVVFRVYRDRDLNPVGRAHRYRVDGDMQIHD